MKRLRGASYQVCRSARGRLRQRSRFDEQCDGDEGNDDQSATGDEHVTDIMSRGTCPDGCHIGLGHDRTFVLIHRTLLTHAANWLPVSIPTKNPATSGKSGFREMCANAPNEWRNARRIKSFQYDADTQLRCGVGARRLRAAQLQRRERGRRDSFEHVARPPSRKRQSVPPERATWPPRLSVLTSTGSLCRPHPQSRPITPFHLRVGRLGGDASEMPRAYLHRCALVRVVALPSSAPRLSDRTIRLRPEDRCRCRRPRAEAKRRSCLRPGALDKSLDSPSPCAPQ
jgi:hypothetical protein